MAFGRKKLEDLRGLEDAKKEAKEKIAEFNAQLKILDKDIKGREGELKEMKNKRKAMVKSLKDMLKG